MSTTEKKTIQVTCPCCDALLTIDSTLAAVLDHKLPVRPQMAVALEGRRTQVKKKPAVAMRSIKNSPKRKEQIKSPRSQVPRAVQKAKEEPITKPLKDIDLD